MVTSIASSGRISRGTERTRLRDRFPWLLAAAYALIFSALGIWRYEVHRNLVDFGIFEQTVASAFGCFCNSIEGSHWGFHFSPILYFIGALVAMWKSPFVLIVSQAVACALVIPPVYVLANRSKLAAIIVFLYPALAGLTFGDFHENGFAPAAVAWAIWAFESGALALSLIFALIAMCVKEDQAIFLGATAAFIAWRDRGTLRGRLATIAAGIGALVVLGFFLIIAPHANVNPNWAPTRFYAWTSADMQQLVPGLLGRAGFIVLAFLPLLFLPFRTPAGWLLALPLTEVLLSRMPTTYTMGTHYAGAWIGYALVAFAFGLRTVMIERMRVTQYACIALSVLELAVANPMHPGLNLRPYQDRDAMLDRTIATLPTGASIATQEEAYAHMALSNPLVTLLPEDPTMPLNACFVLLDRDFPESPRVQEFGAAFDRKVASGIYRAIASDVYKSTFCP